LYVITLNDTHTHTPSAGLLWMRDRVFAESHKRLATDIHDSSGILNRNHNNRIAAELRLLFFSCSLIRCVSEERAVLDYVLRSETFFNEFYVFYTG
jgi:hypothetical protein